MLFVNPTHLSAWKSVRLNGCNGWRYDEGTYVECQNDCVAHFDTNPDVDEDGPDNPYPNSILSWVALTPNARRVTDLTPFGVPLKVAPAWLVVHEVVAVFHNQVGDVLTVWVVNTFAQDEDAHFASAFLSRDAATTFVEVLLVRHLLAEEITG